MSNGKTYKFMKTRKWVGITILGILLTFGLTQQSLAQHKGRHHKAHGDGKRKYGGMNTDFSHKIYRITEADSTQKIKMKSLLAKADKRLEVFRKDFQDKEKKLIDSVKAQLKPILREDQFKKLEEFKKISH